MDKKENLDINYLNKFNKARTESDEEANFNREIEAVAAENVNFLIQEGRAFFKEKRGSDNDQELEEVTVTLPNGKIIFYANEKALKEFSENTAGKVKSKLSSNAEKKANFYDGEPITLIAFAEINKAMRSGAVIEDKKYSKNGEGIEESTIKLTNGTVVSYMNIKEINKISKENEERRAVAQKIAQEKLKGRTPSDNN